MKRKIRVFVEAMQDSYVVRGPRVFGFTDMSGPLCPEPALNGHINNLEPCSAPDSFLKDWSFHFKEFCFSTVKCVGP